MDNVVAKRNMHCWSDDRLDYTDCPCIIRLSPGESNIEFEWFDYGSGEIDHTVAYYEIICENNVSETVIQSLDSYTGMITGLTPDHEYVLNIERTIDRKKSSERRFRTGKVPGTVVNYLHPMDQTFGFSGQFLGSPAIVKLDSGALIASMDVFASGTSQDLSFIFRSDNNGASWHYITNLSPCFWGKLFVHKEILYMLAVSTALGDLVIGCSYDEGYSWSAPVTIFKAGRCSSCDMVKGFHKAPTPIVPHEGRLWVGIEYGGCHCINDNFLISIDENKDLLNLENWVYSEFMSYDETWEGAAKGPCNCCIEGNAVVGPDGEIYNFLRYQINNCIPNHGKALLLKGDAYNPQKKLEFSQFIDFNSALSKFDVIRDPLTEYYFSIANKVVNSKTPLQRNVLVVLISKDLINWKEAAVLIDFRNMPTQEIGFQYVDFIIAGDDILYLSRTAFNQANNFHDSNYVTFHKIKDFRNTLVP